MIASMRGIVAFFASFLTLVVCDSESTSYSLYSSGIPDVCGTDLIGFEPNASTLSLCQAACTSDTNCNFLAFSTVGNSSCGLYSTACSNQTNTTCSLRTCYKTYKKNLPSSEHIAARAVPAAAQGDKQGETLASLMNVVQDLQRQLAALQSTCGAFRRDGDRLFLERVSLHVLDANFLISTSQDSCSDATRGIGNVVIGHGHDVSAASNGLVAGSANTISGCSSSVTGGSGNSASGDFSSVSGGRENVASARTSSVSGGLRNRATGEHTTVAGGQRGEASGFTAFVGGGSNNDASGSASVVCGGNANSASATNAATLGGQNNQASGAVAVVSGGAVNHADFNFASISGGRFNVASGFASSILGGFEQRIDGAFPSDRTIPSQ